MTGPTFAEVTALVAVLRPLAAHVLFGETRSFRHSEMNVRFQQDQMGWMAPAPGIRVPKRGSDQATTSEGSHPLWKLPPSASIWLRTFIKSTPSTAPVKLLCARRYAGHRC